LMAGRLRFYRIILSAFWFFLVSAAVSPAQEQNTISVKASVDRLKITQGEPLNFKVEITGNLTAGPEITLPDLKKDFEVISTMQSQSLSIRGKERSRQLDFIYVLVARAAGKLTIGEVSVKIGKQSFLTQAIDIEVMPSSSPQTQMPANPPQNPDEEEPGQEETIL
jgi:uncharacterized protein (DUF58 family)